MIQRIPFRIIDLAVFVIANLINLLITAMFLARARKLPQAGNVIGLVVVAMAIPLAAAVVMNLLSKRNWPFWILPLMTIAYCILEFILDYILKVDFRHSSLLIPYLISFYLGLFAMIGYTFLVGKRYGFITLVTYFINLAATFYSYARVGHG
jgi:hypothetical protein